MIENTRLLSYLSASMVGFSFLISYKYPHPGHFSSLAPEDSVGVFHSNLWVDP